MDRTKDAPKIFLEKGEGVPTSAVGVECGRERGASSALPPLNFIHIWWARRPLAASRFALIGSLVGDDWSHEDVLELLGVPRGKDPVNGQILVDEVKSGRRKERVKNPYGYPRAYTNVLSPSALRRFRDACRSLWGTKTPVVLDPFSGGGSIPFEALRIGLRTQSVELNPVACVAQEAAVILPSEHGPKLSKQLRSIGKELVKGIEGKMTPYFPRGIGEDELCYIWVRSVRCPNCGLDAPLTPNWWLDTKNRIGFMPITAKDSDTPTYRVQKAGTGGFDPDKGSQSRGTGECVRCGNPIPGDHIKAQAQAGVMNHQLAAVGYKKKGMRGRHFRSPSQQDLEAIQKAEEELKKNWQRWEITGLIPIEPYPKNTNDARPLTYGMPRWCDFFNPRQLLVHLTTIETIQQYDWSSTGDDETKALRTLLALVVDKGLDYNSIESRIDTSRAVVKNTFDRHDFAFKWNYGEIDGAGHLFKWGIDQVADAYEGCLALAEGATGIVALHNGDARDLSWIGDGSVHAVVTDPPYYENVMYAELSDFFYVWQKRTIGDIHPEWFSPALADKDNEAVANVARFKGFGGRSSASKMAHEDYELKMTQAWQEAHRVLVDGGVLTIMFNHKKLEAWDALAKSIINAGFTITSSWAISTESEHSLHIREKQAVQRTIFLVARKIPQGSGAWWEDVKKELESAVAEKLSKVMDETPHVSRIDLLMSAYGEGLRVVSGHWPVRDPRGGEIEVADALKAARSVLQDWYFTNILEHRPDFDTLTKVILYALEDFREREADYDDVHKYGLALGLDPNDLYTSYAAVRKSSKTLFLSPEERLKVTSRIDPDREEYSVVWDRVQAASLVFKDQDADDFRRWLIEKGLLADRSFLDACAFLSREGPSELLETKMARSVASKGISTDTRGQRTLGDYPGGER
jgi:adenine-specific DNA methylase